MRDFGELWKLCHSGEIGIDWEYQHLLLVDGVEYKGSEIKAWKKNHGLIYDDFSIGNCISGKLEITLQVKQGHKIARNALIQSYIRVVTSDRRRTAWNRFGNFFIDKRKKDGRNTKFECYDRMLFGEQPYIQDLEVGVTWPLPCTVAMERILQTMGTTLDPRTKLDPTFMVEYPNKLTLREILGFIASGHGGNFYITDEDRLMLVVPKNTPSVYNITRGLVKKINSSDPRIVDKVFTVWSDDGDFWESSGKGSNELEVFNLFALPTTPDRILNILKGYEYNTFDLRSTEIDPALELGDSISVEGVTANFWQYTYNMRLYADILIPTEGDTTREFGFQGTVTSTVKRRVGLDSRYYGISIGRKFGLHMIRDDGKSEMTINSDVWEVKINNGQGLQRVLYIDYLSTPPKLVFNGELGFNASSVINQRISNEVNQITTDMASMELSIKNGFNVRIQQTEQVFNGEINKVNTALAEMHLTLDGFFTSVRDMQGNLSSLALRATQIEMLVGGSSTTNLVLNQNQITMQSRDISLLGDSIRIGNSGGKIGFFGVNPVAKQSSAVPTNGSSSSSSLTLASSVISSITTGTQPSTVLTSINTAFQPSSVVTGLNVSTSSWSNINTIVTQVNTTTGYVPGFGSVVTGISTYTTSFYGGYVVTGVTPQTSPQPSTIATGALSGTQPNSVITGGSLSYQSGPWSVLTSVSFGNLQSALAGVRDALTAYGLL